jgi:predicted transcriptional regulator
LKDLCDLLFELSSEERVTIMRSLQDERMKLSHLAKKLDMTVTETSRQLQRLSDSLLVAKDVDGTFSPTLYGELAVSLLLNLDFISENRQYFLDHRVSNIPYGFINRLGELSSSTYEMDSVKVITHCTELLKNAEDYIWAQSYQLLPDHVPIIEDHIKNGCIFRGIFPENIDLPLPLLPNIRTRNRVELRILVTEKAAMSGFEHLTGTPHYSGFFSEDSKFIEWCKEVHQHYWERSKPATISKV